MQFLNTLINWPLDINVIRKGTENNTFGMVRRNLDGSPRPHQGWDFAALNGTPFYSISDGLVERISDIGALGLTVVIRIAKTDYYTAYCHLSEIDVKTGDLVKIGQYLGKTGSTGNASGMPIEDQHLHFEIRTTPYAGTGLANRISPLKVFGTCPLKESIKREPIIKDN